MLFWTVTQSRRLARIYAILVLEVAWLGYGGLAGALTHAYSIVNLLEFSL